MTCYGMETEYRSGVRFIPVRRTDGNDWLDTQYLAESAAEALAGARRSEECEVGSEWTAANELIGVAEVDVQIVGFLALSAMERAEPAEPAVSSAA